MSKDKMAKAIALKCESSMSGDDKTYCSTGEELFNEVLDWMTNTEVVIREDDDIVWLTMQFELGE